MIPALDELRVIAHRGASSELPENTLPAFELALERGADAIELDVQLTRDGAVVVHHDRTLSRFGLPGRTLADVTAAEATRLRVPDGPREATLPAFADVLDAVGRRTVLLVELKPVERGPDAAARHRLLVDEVARAVRRARLARRVLLLCFDRALLEHAATAAPRLGRVLNVRPAPLGGGPSASTLRGLAAVSADVRTLTPRWGRAVRRAGLPLFCFTCNTPRRVASALAGGATGLMSDRPGWLAARLPFPLDR